MAENTRGNSYFDGTTLGLIGMRLLTGLLTGITLGIAFPWAMCMLTKWEAEHTVINGRRLKFTGTGGELFVKYIIWSILTCITCGIYSFWLGLNMEKWRVKHLVYADDNSGIESEFNAGVIDWIINHIGFYVLSGITFGIALPWAEKNLIKWKMEHTHIGGDVLTFTGTGGQLFVMYLLLGLLSGITCGIYAIFFPIKYMKWHAENTRVWRKADTDVAISIPAEKGSGKGVIIGVVVAVVVIAVSALAIFLGSIGFSGMYEASIATEASSEYEGDYIDVEEYEEIPELTEERAWELIDRQDNVTRVKAYYFRSIGLEAVEGEDIHYDEYGFEMYPIEGIETMDDMIECLSRDFTLEYIENKLLNYADYEEVDGQVYFLTTWEAGFPAMSKDSIKIEKIYENKYKVFAQVDYNPEAISNPYHYYDIVLEDGMYKINGVRETEVIE